MDDLFSYTACIWYSWPYSSFEQAWQCVNIRVKLSNRVRTLEFMISCSMDHRTFRASWKNKKTNINLCRARA